MYEHSPKKGRRKIVSREHLLNIGFFFGEKLGFDVDRDHSSGIFSGFIHGLEANSITFRWVPMAMSGDVGMWFVWMADGWLDRWVLCISIELTNHVFLTSGQPHHFYFTAAGGNMKETRMIIHLKRRFLKLDIESWLQGPLLFFTFGVDCFAKCFFFCFWLLGKWFLFFWFWSFLLISLTTFCQCPARSFFWVLIRKIQYVSLQKRWCIVAISCYFRIISTKQHTCGFRSQLKMQSLLTGLRFEACLEHKMASETFEP